MFIQQECDPTRLSQQNRWVKKTLNEFTKSLCNGGKRDVPRVSRPQWHCSVLERLILPNQRYHSYSGDILKLLCRNFCCPAHKSQFGCKQEILEDRPVEYSAAPETHVLHFYLRNIWFEVPGNWLRAVHLFNVRLNRAVVLLSCGRTKLLLQFLSLGFETSISPLAEHS